MKRYLEIEKIVYQELEKNCFGNKKRQGYRHLFGVSTLCIAYSQYVQLDCELCAIMGLSSMGWPSALTTRPISASPTGTDTTLPVRLTVLPSLICTK